MKNSNELVVHPCKAGEVQMFNVSNNDAGVDFVRSLRKALNRETYDIRVRGSLANRTELRKQDIWLSDQSVPLRYADRLRVYIEKKREVLISHTIKEQKLQDELRELSASYAESEELSRQLKAQLKQKDVLLHDTGKELDQIHRELSEAESDIYKLKEEIRSLRYAGLSDEELDIVKEYENSIAIKFANSIYNGQNKLHIVKAICHSTPLKLKHAKLVCDHLVFK